MSCRGVLFALTNDEDRRLLDAAGDDDAALALVQEEVEDRWDEPWVCELDKAWDAIDRCLGDGTDPAAELCVLGGRHLHAGGSYIVSHKTAEQVRAAAAACGAFDEAEMRRLYFSLDAIDYGESLTEDDFGYTWENFAEMREFYRRAAGAGRAVIFTVDQ